MATDGKPKRPEDATSMTRMHEMCDAVGEAVDRGTVGATFRSTEQIINNYYTDVQDQAKKSFASARFVAFVGFWVLIATLAYALIFDALSRITVPGLVMAQVPKTVVTMGAVSGALIEFIAGINFWLYARTSRQFGAFHICLERTQRYLTAYKIALETQGTKDEALYKLVCIMANAPMITQPDTPALDSAIEMPRKTEASVNPASNQ